MADACASLTVGALAPTSTMAARPLSSTCVSLSLSPALPLLELPVLLVLALLVLVLLLKPLLQRPLLAAAAPAAAGAAAGLLRPLAAPA